MFKENINNRYACIDFVKNLSLWYRSGHFNKNLAIILGILFTEEELKLPIFESAISDVINFTVCEILGKCYKSNNIPDAEQKLQKKLNIFLNKKEYSEVEHEFLIFSQILLERYPERYAVLTDSPTKEMTVH